MHTSVPPKGNVHGPPCVRFLSHVRRNSRGHETLVPSDVIPRPPSSDLMDAKLKLERELTSALSQVKQNLDAQISDSSQQLENQFDGRLSEWSSLITEQAGEKVKLDLSLRLQTEIQNLEKNLDAKLLELEGETNAKTLAGELGLTREVERAEKSEVAGFFSTLLRSRSTTQQEASSWTTTRKYDESQSAFLQKNCTGHDCDRQQEPRSVL